MYYSNKLLRYPLILTLFETEVTNFPFDLKAALADGRLKLPRIDNFDFILYAKTRSSEGSKLSIAHLTIVVPFFSCLNTFVGCKAPIGMSPPIDTKPGMLSSISIPLSLFWDLFFMCRMTVISDTPPSLLEMLLASFSIVNGDLRP